MLMHIFKRLIMSSNTEHNQTQQSEQVQSSAQPAAPTQEYNFARMRKWIEEERQARIAAEERLQQLQRASQERQRGYQAEEEEDDEDPYVDKKKLERKLSSFERKLEQKIEEKAEMKARTLLEQEKRESYLRENKDFYNIMSEDNLDRFAQEHPRLAENFMRMPDGFERQKLVYETIKTLQSERDRRSFAQEKIDMNKKSPYYQPSNIANAPFAAQGDFSSAGQKAAYDKLQQLKSSLRIG